MVKNLPAMQETWVRSLGWKDPLKKGKATPLQYSGLEAFLDKENTLKSPYFANTTSVSKESACSAGDLGSIPGSGRSTGERNGQRILAGYS